jgi:hypothetical protein
MAGFYSFIDANKVMTLFYNGITSDPSWNEFFIVSPYHTYISHLLVEQ